MVVAARSKGAVVHSSLMVVAHLVRSVSGMVNEVENNLYNYENTNKQLTNYVSFTAVIFQVIMLQSWQSLFDLPRQYTYACNLQTCNEGKYFVPLDRDAMKSSLWPTRTLADATSVGAVVKYPDILTLSYDCKRTAAAGLVKARLIDWTCIANKARIM